MIALKQKMMMTPISMPEQLNEESVLSTILLQDLPDDILLTIFKHLNSGPDFVKLSINHPKFKRVLEEMMDHSDFEDFPIYWIDEYRVAPSGRSYSQFHIGYKVDKPFNFPDQKVFPLDAYAVKLSPKICKDVCYFSMPRQVRCDDIAGRDSVTNSDLDHLNVWAVNLSPKIKDDCNFSMLSQVKYVDISCCDFVTDSDLVYLKNVHTLIAEDCQNLTDISGLRGSMIKKLNLGGCCNPVSYTHLRAHET